MQQLFHAIGRNLIRRWMPPPPPAAVDSISHLYLFQENKKPSPLFPSSLSRSLYTHDCPGLDQFMLRYCARYRNSAKLKRTAVKKGAHSYLKFHGFPRVYIRRIFGTTPSIFQNKAVHSFLKTHHFSRAQISKIQLPLSALQTAQPNIEFLRSKGLSGRQTAKVICSCPTLFTVSLANQIAPAYDALKSFFQSDSNTLTVIRNCPELLLENVDPLLARSCNILSGCGEVPQSGVVRLLTASPWIISMRENDLKRVVERLKDEMGFDPSTHKFHEALGIITRSTMSQWECQLRVFKKWGLSEDQVIAGFRRFPKLMSTPAEKINGVMELFVNSLGWEPSVVIVNHPVLLVYGLSERFTPRIGVLLNWVSNGLMKKEDISPCMFKSTNKCFLNKYVLHKAPGLLSLFPKGGISVDRETDVGKGQTWLTVHA